MIPPFSFATAGRIRFGNGALSQMGDDVAGLGPRILIVTDAGLLATGIVDRALAVLGTEGRQVAVFSEVVADPPEAIIHRATEAAITQKATGIIGLGGGSSLDVAKLVAVLARKEEKLADIYGVGNVTGGRLPLMLVPTTAGTGSEVTPISIVTTGAKEKMGVVSPVLLPDVALLDPELTRDLPAHITAATGVDAMVHAIEAFASASPNNNPISRQLAVAALRLMGGALERAVHEADEAARADMLLGSMLAGQAFANSPVAAVHALAYPIGGHFGVPHGLSNALVLPHVLRFNAETKPDAYAALLPHAFPDAPRTESHADAALFADLLADLSARCGLQQTLREVGIGKGDLPALARDAMNQTRLLINNPRPVTEADAVRIYSAAF